MAKYHKWKLSIDGTEHEIECVRSNNRYILYANGEYVTTVYRKLYENLRGGVKEVVNIAGKECRFVVWNNIPDLEVDGKMLCAGCTYEKGFQQFRNSRKAMSVVWLCGAILWALMVALKIVDLGGLFFVIVSLLVCFLYVRAWRSMKE